MVYESCCNAQMNLIVDTMTCTCIVMHLSVCQFPSCNLFTQHVSYLLWRDTTSELWTPIHSFTSDNTIYCKHCSFILSANKHNFPHYTSNPFFQQASEIDNLTVKLGQNNLVMLCRFHVNTIFSGTVARERKCQTSPLQHANDLLALLTPFRSVFIFY